MPLSKKAKKGIEREASRILDELKINKPPVSASLILGYIEKKFGPVVESPFSTNLGVSGKKIEGFSQSSRSGSVIGWDKRRDQTIQEYIKIHEAGHVIYNHGDSFRKSVGGYEDTEEICDYFALCIIVNPHFLKNYWKTNHNTLSLANIFNTSPAYISKMLFHQGISH